MNIHPFRMDWRRKEKNYRETWLSFKWHSIVIQAFQCKQLIILLSSIWLFYKPILYTEHWAKCFFANCHFNCHVYHVSISFNFSCGFNLIRDENRKYKRMISICSIKFIVSYERSTFTIHRALKSQSLVLIES